MSPQASSPWAIRAAALKGRRTDRQRMLHSIGDSRIMGKKA
jgi:hypothetical protein